MNRGSPHSAARSWGSVPCENPSAAPCHRSLHVCAVRKDALYVFGGAWGDWVREWTGT